MNNKRDTQKKRLILVLRNISIITLIGIIYAIIISYTNFYIPCVFRTITGLKCPGCGISHMFMYILHLDFLNAIKSNIAAFIVVPILMILGIKKVYVYIKTGIVKSTKIENYLLMAILIFLVLFGIIRNIV